MLQRGGTALAALSRAAANKILWRLKQKDGIAAMNKTRFADLIQSVIILGGMLLIAGATHALAMPGGQGVKPLRADGSATPQTTLSAIPPIDAAQPAEYETASFGMG